MSSRSIYCAFCKIQRSIMTSKHVSWTNSLLCVVLGFITSYSVWQVFDERTLFLSAICLVAGELFVQLRYRLALTCPHCGFDPVLYMKDAEAAASRVRSTLQVKRETAGLIRPEMNPFNNLATMKAPSAKQPGKKKSQFSIQA